MARKRNLVVSGWNRHHFYLIPTIRVSDSHTQPKRFCITFFFLGWQVFFTRYEEWTADDFKNHIEKIKKEKFGGNMEKM